MHWFIDFVLLAVLLTYTFRHFRLGLMHTVFSILKFVLSVIAAVILGRHVGYWLADNYISSPVTERVYEKLVNFTGGSASLSEFFENIPSGFNTFVGLFGVDVSSLEEGFGGLQSSEEVLRDMAETIANPIVNTVSAIIAYMTVFLLSYLLLSLIIKGLQKIKIPILTGVDKTLGLLLGVALGLFHASLISTVIYCVIEYLAAVNSDPTVMSVYADSYMFRFIYDLKFFEFVRNLI